MSVLQDYEQYEEYYDDVSVFDSSDYQDQEDTAGEVDYFLGRRRRRQTQVLYCTALYYLYCDAVL